MKIHLQTIINVCFAISITAFIYQNNSQQDKIDTLESYAQVDTDNTWDRLDAIDMDIKDIQGKLNANVTFSLGISETTLTNGEEITRLFANFDTAKENDDLLMANIKILDENITNINKRIEILGDVVFN